MYKKLAKELLNAYNNEVANDSDYVTDFGQNFVFNWPKWIEARISFAVKEKNSCLQSKVKPR